MSIIVDGKKIAQAIEKKLQQQVKELKAKGLVPKLAVVLVGQDKSSVVYVRIKEQVAKRIGLDFELKKLAENISETNLLAEIQKIQKTASGVIVQLPLPKHLDVKKIINSIDPNKDVDCLTEINWGKLVCGTNIFEPPTAGAMLEILKYHKINLQNKEVVVIGKGELVGKPLALMLLQKKCTLTICNKNTKDLSLHTKKADIIFTGVGQHNLLNAQMIKKDAIIIDAGISFVKEKMYGDIDFVSVCKKASLVTPTPGGVGPITVIKLIENTVASSTLL
jgi:methylenetetrahydrofolate dehydrogenase (NADP+)/methenyltetrahydrofolate cyclohydrolase